MLLSVGFLARVSIIGIHECVFRADNGGNGVMFGVVPVSKATKDTLGSAIGQFYHAHRGNIFGPGHGRIRTGVKYGEGDAIAVTLDLNAATVTFAKNGAAVSKKSTVSIDRDEAHYFAFNTYKTGCTVTIMSMK